ncbi:MAG: DUF2029 domain-containing protein [Acidobacteria bacterium]|nr:DUF2029 domain-containing protein [Acidobacteriota bacterium]
MKSKSAGVWWLVLAAVLAAHAGGIYYFRDRILKGETDFASFYAAGRGVQQGHGRELYRYETQREFQKEFPSRSVPLLFYHPPFQLVLFLPLAYLPFVWAYALWLLMNVLLVVGLGFLRHPGDELHPPPDGASAVPRMVAAFAFFPVFLALLHGQDSVILLWLFCLAFLTLRHGMDFEAGCFLALGLFKFQFVLPLVAVMALKKKGRLLLGVATVAVALVAISALMVGWSGIVEYVDFLGQTDRVQAHGTIQAAGMANLRGLVASAFGHSLSRNAVATVTATLSLLLLIAVARLWPKSADENGGQFDLAFAATVTAAVLASYHLNKHDATLLLLPIALAVRHLKCTKAAVLWARRLLWLALFALFYPPLHLSDNQFRYPAPVLWAMLLFVFAVAAEARRLGAAVTPNGQN